MSFLIPFLISLFMGLGVGGGGPASLIEGGGPQSLTSCSHEFCKWWKESLYA